MKSLTLTTLLASSLLITACGPSQQITRVAPDTQTDLSGRWNDTDARLVAEEMISDASSRPWVYQFRENHGGDAPVVIVGQVSNQTMEHIDTEVFTKEMERSFVNTGMVTLVASSDERDQIREERLDQQSFSSFESAKALAQELGADYIMIGNINSIVDESVTGNEASIFYTVNLELINVETNVKVWIGNKQIKKVIERRNLRS